MTCSQTSRVLQVDKDERSDTEPDSSSEDERMSIERKAGGGDAVSQRTGSNSTVNNNLGNGTNAGLHSRQKAK